MPTNDLLQERLDVGCFKRHTIQYLGHWKYPCHAMCYHGHRLPQSWAGQSWGLGRKYRVLDHIQHWAGRSAGINDSSHARISSRQQQKRARFVALGNLFDVLIQELNVLSVRTAHNHPQELIASVFSSKLNYFVFGCFDPIYVFLLIKITIFRGEISDISAKTAQLLITFGWLSIFIGLLALWAAFK